MMDEAIRAFFEKRKEAWLGKRVTASMDDLELKQIRIECEEFFSLKTWLPAAAQRAGQMSLATHPCTFSHPSSRKNNKDYASSVIAELPRATDGYLRTGNIVVEADALGNAAVLDVYNFLTLKMEDTRTLIEHLQENSELALNLLTIQTASYETLKNGFLSMIHADKQNASVTSSKIKQVYFPVKDSYHQLSVLSNSGIIFELKNRIDHQRFSDDVKKIKESRRNNIYSETGFSEISNLTTIGYGGTKPQNISVLNNQNRGQSHLLLSLPPVLNKRTIHFPKQNFFQNSFRYREYQDIFAALHQLFKTDYNNKNIREGRDYRLQDLMDRIIEKMWAVRAISEEQYQPDHSQLKIHQKIWLCDKYQQQREEENEWLDKLCKEITSWIILIYEKLLGKNAYKLGSAEREHILGIVISNKEALR